MMRLLERNREHRYATGAALATDLDAFVAGRKASASPSANLAAALESLFPGEKKRQQGWLKPRIAPSASMPPPTLRPPTPKTKT